MAGTQWPHPPRDWTCNFAPQPGLRVVARVDALGLTLAPVLYHADSPGLPYVPSRDRCPGARP